VRFSLEYCKGELVFLPEDVQGAVEPPSQCNLRAWRWQRGFGTFKLYPLCIQGNCGIVIDRACRGEAEDVAKLPLAIDAGTMNILKMVKMSEAVIVIISKHAVKIIIGPCNGGDIFPSQRFQEPVLKRSV